MSVEGNGDTPLESYKVCVICLGPRGDLNTPYDLSKDHLIPAEVCNQFNPGLKPLARLSEDKMRIHVGEHAEIDFRKFEAFRRYGLIGLFEFLAYDYPRSVNEKVAKDQEYQIIRLFTAVNRSITRLNGRTPSNFADDYHRVRCFTKEYIEGWIGQNPHYQIPLLDLLEQD